MDNIEFKKLAHELACEIAMDVLRILNAKEKAADEGEWVTCKEAAKIIGVSPAYLRRIQNRFPHTKQGDNKQGQLRFLKEALKKNYIKGGMD